MRTSRPPTRPPFDRVLVARRMARSRQVASSSRCLRGILPYTPSLFSPVRAVGDSTSSARRPKVTTATSALLGSEEIKRKSWPWSKDQRLFSPMALDRSRTNTKRFLSGIWYWKTGGRKEGWVSTAKLSGSLILSEIFAWLLLTLLLFSNRWTLRLDSTTERTDCLPQRMFCLVGRSSA